jgi:transcriptional regulator with XRE-family HTH domain
MPKGSPRDVDRHVGARVNLRRTEIGMPLGDFADRLGVRYQQAHKYETGLNKLSPARLLDAARILQVEVGYFFAGLEEGGQAIERASSRQFEELARQYHRIQRAEDRKVLCLVGAALARRQEG